MAAAAIVEQDPTLPPVTHDAMLRALRGEPVPRAPCWAMRQAGRYLPEFRALRAKAGFFEVRVAALQPLDRGALPLASSFPTLPSPPPLAPLFCPILRQVCNDPALCSEATLQPLRRFPATLDAVVVFSDILIVPQAMGLEVRMEPGPVFPAPLASPADLAARVAAGELTLRPDAAAAFAPLYAGIAATRRAAAAAAAAGGCGKALPVIGFCGAPWTLLSYMVAGLGRPSPQPLLSGKDSAAERSRVWLYSHAPATHALLRALAELCTELLVGCWRAGASVLQVFESGAGELPPALFREFALPYMKAIAAGVRARTPPLAAGGPALIAFPRNQHSRDGLEGLCDSQYDALSLDWGWDPAEAASRVAAECVRLGRVGGGGEGAGAGAAPQRPLALQGNADPALLFGSREEIWRGVRDMLVGFRAGWRAGAGACAALRERCSVVGNLGHGMLPGHDAEALGEFFAAVGEVSGALAAGGQAAEAEAAASDAWLARLMAGYYGGLAAVGAQ